MRSLRASLAGTIILALLAGMGGAAAAVTESPAPTPSEQLPSQEFPTGTFVGVWDDRVKEFDEDGTGRATDTRSCQAGSYQVEFTYAVHGDLYEQTSIVYMGEPEELPPSPPYRWRFDGEYLTFEAVFEDPDRYRQQAYEQPHRYVAEPRTVVIAADDIEAGARLWMGNTELRVVPGADVPVDTLTDSESATLATATVAITKGQPITPAMLEPPE